MLLVRVDGVEGGIVGYGPGPNGQPLAIVVLNNQLHAVALSAIEIVRAPRKLRKKDNGVKAYLAYQTENDLSS